MEVTSVRGRGGEVCQHTNSCCVFILGTGGEKHWGRGYVLAKRAAVKLLEAMGKEGGGSLMAPPHGAPSGLPSGAQRLLGEGGGGRHAEPAAFPPPPLAQSAPATPRALS